MSAETTVVPFTKSREVSVLSLPGSVTETSLTLPDGLTYDEWEEVGKRLRGAEKAVRWWIGDWLAYGERTYGETYKQATAVTGYTTDDLRTMASISARIPPCDRSHNLSWSHHREVVALESPDERERWLKKAEENKWSKRDLHAQMALTRERPEPAEEHAPTCSRCGQPCRPCEIEIMKSGKGRKAKKS